MKINLFLTGEKQLEQFLMGTPKFHLTKSGHKLKARFTLHRNPKYMVINFYIPSFCTMLMTILPLYLRTESHFATTITLVLTSILCLFTLLQSSISHIPNTAYLKFIDYWNMLIMAVTLANFFTLVTWEIGDHSHSTKILRQIKYFMRIAIPLITFFGVTIYWIIAGLMFVQF